MEREVTPSRLIAHRDYGLERRTPPGGVTEFIVEESSQAYDDPDERALFRAGQLPEKRFEKLEEFKDAAIVEFSAIKVAVAETNTSIARVEERLDAQTQSLTDIKDALKRREEKDDKKEMLHLEADVDIKKAGKIQLIKNSGTKLELAKTALAIVGTGTAIVLALVQAGKC